jgi:hypothetical protein
MTSRIAAVVVMLILGGATFGIIARYVLGLGQPAVAVAWILGAGLGAATVFYDRERSTRRRGV